MGCCWSAGPEYDDLSGEGSYEPKAVKATDKRGVAEGFTVSDPKQKLAAPQAQITAPTPKAVSPQSLIGCWKGSNLMAICFNDTGSFTSYHLMPKKGGPTQYKVTNSSQPGNIKLVFLGTSETFSAMATFSGDAMNLTVENEDAVVFQKWPIEERAKEFIEELQKALAGSDTFLEKELKTLERRFLMSLSDLKALGVREYSSVIETIVSRVAQIHPTSPVVQRIIVSDTRRAAGGNLDERLVGAWLMPFMPRAPPEVHALVFNPEGDIELPMPGVKHKEKGSIVTNSKANPCTIDCLFKNQETWDLGIYEINGKTLKMELGQRGSGQRPLAFGRRTINAKFVVKRDEIEFLGAVGSVLDSLKPIFVREKADITLLSQFLKKEKLTLDQQDSSIMKMQEIFSKLKIGEQFSELEGLYEVTLDDCKNSVDSGIIKAIDNLTRALRA